MTRREMRQGLKAGRTLMQAKDCSTQQELDDVNDMKDEGLVWVSDWEYRRCRSCGFDELHRQVTWRSSVVEAEAIRALPIETQQTVALPRWRHIKRGSTYTELGQVGIQSDAPVKDEDVLILYRGDDGKYWARPASEFAGQFERIDAEAVDEGF